MRRATQLLWDDQNRHPGDRQRLFTAVAEVAEIGSVLYPGSFVDIAPSFVFDAVTYVDTDARARQFFDDREGVLEIIAANAAAGTPGSWRFINADYRAALPLPEAGFDLLVSLYAGFVSEHCTQYLKPGGLLLVNPSHGDAAMASMDDRYALVGAVLAASGAYRIERDDLDIYLVPKGSDPVTRDDLHRTGRGIAYTRSAFAYLFSKL